MSATVNPHPLYDLPIEAINGEQTSLAAYRGKVLLIVNVASKCGLTPQYEALEQIYSQYQSEGLVVLGFPSNDFAGQEPGSNADIHAFCTTTFSVTFPMHSKTKVLGAGMNPLYQTLTRAIPNAVSTAVASIAAGAGTASIPFRDQIAGYLATIGLQPTAPPDILWNFEKFVVDREGNILHRFSPEVLPTDPTVIAALEAALNA